MFKRYLYLNYHSFSGFKFWFSRRITSMGWIVLFATLIAVALSVDPTVTVAYQTFTFLLFIILAALILNSRRKTRRIAFERVLPKFGSVGQPLFYSVLLRNDSKKTQRSLTLFDEPPDPRPAFRQFAERPELEKPRGWMDRAYRYDWWKYLIQLNTRARIQEHELPDLNPGVTETVRLELTPLARGALRLQRVVFASPDPFGLFYSLRKISAPQSILILPRRYPMPGFELPGAIKFQQGGVSMASSIGESEEFVSLREYRPGDPLRHIHWKSFAKIGKPIVKEFQEEFFVRHALVLDTFSARKHSAVFEEAVSVAASIACSIQAEDCLLDLMFVGPKAFCFTTGRGVAHTEQMLEILASVQTCRDKTFDSLERAVFEHATQISGCICIFLEWNEPRKKLVRSLKAMKIPLLVFVVTATDVPLDAGPMADEPQHFHPLPLGKIEEKLATL
jgi:uncharacterized protein (DUF58 family)